MSLSALSIDQGCVLQAAPTGGTALTLAPDGIDVPNGIHVSDTINADFLTRVNATFKNRPPALQADGSWSKAKRSMLCVVPMELADGSYSFNLVRIEVEFHPETTVADVQSLRFLGSQLLSGTDTVDFINRGSLA